nr:chitin-binding lectin 1-like [Anas platyrhynchos]
MARHGAIWRDMVPACAHNPTAPRGRDAGLRPPSGSDPHIVPKGGSGGGFCGEPAAGQGQGEARRPAAGIAPLHKAPAVRNGAFCEHAPGPEPVTPPPPLPPSPPPPSPPSFSSVRHVETTKHRPRSAPLNALRAPPAPPPLRCFWRTFRSMVIQWGHGYLSAPSSGIGFGGIDCNNSAVCKSSRKNECNNIHHSQFRYKNLSAANNTEEVFTVEED